MQGLAKSLELQRRGATYNVKKLAYEVLLGLQRLAQSLMVVRTAQDFPTGANQSK